MNADALRLPAFSKACGRAKKMRLFVKSFSGDVLVINSLYSSCFNYEMACR